jgi:hypothetical protein
MHKIILHPDLLRLVAELLTYLLFCQPKAELSLKLGRFLPISSRLSPFQVSWL